MQGARASWRRRSARVGMVGINTRLILEQSRAVRRHQAIGHRPRRLSREMSSHFMRKVKHHLH
jgi:hypothetical protein